jgi:hypothetical protein
MENKWTQNVRAATMACDYRMSVLQYCAFDYDKQSVRAQHNGNNRAIMTVHTLHESGVTTPKNRKI